MKYLITITLAIVASLLILKVEYKEQGTPYEGKPVEWDKFCTYLGECYNTTEFEKFKGK